jgi:hypothetical protein
MNEMAGRNSQLSIRKGADRFGVAAPVRVTPAPKVCGKVGPYLRCLSARRGASVIQDIEPASRLVDRKVIHDRVIHRMWFHPFPVSLGYRSGGRIGNPSDLLFLAADGRLLNQIRLPDSISRW